MDQNTQEALSAIAKVVKTLSAGSQDQQKINQTVLDALARISDELIRAQRENLIRLGADEIIISQIQKHIERSHPDFGKNLIAELDVELGKTLAGQPDDVLIEARQRVIGVIGPK